MTTITRKAEYAVIIMAVLSSLPEGESTVSAAIAADTDIPVNLVVQTLARLSKAGWTRSIRGPFGGVALAADPDKITLRAVIELIDGAPSITRCLSESFLCRNKTECKLRGIWEKAQAAMFNVLDEITVKELAQVLPTQASSK